MLFYLIACLEANEDTELAPEYSTIQVIESGQVICTDVVDRQVSPFEDPYRLPFDYSKASWNHDELQHWVGAEGAMVADWSGDGLPDIYIPNMGQDALFVQQADGSFIDEAAERGLSNTRGYSIGGISADFNGDKLLDIALLSYLSPFQLLLNTGDGHFEMADTNVQIPSEAYTPAIAVGDPDADGDMDIVLGSIGILPDGDIPFESPGATLFLQDATQFIPNPLPYDGLPPQTFFASFLDLNDDLVQDIYLINDHGPEVQANQIYMSQPELENPAVLTAVSPLDFAGDGMGLGVGDINNDGYVDLLVTDYGRNHLFLSDARMSWYDAADVAGIQPVPDLQTVAWGAEIIDINHDGLLDIWIAYGQSIHPDNQMVTDPLDFRYQPDAVFLQRTDGTFEPMAAEWGLDREAVSRGGVWSDIDRNGFLDFVSIAQDEEPIVHFATCDESKWLTISLQDLAPNTQAIGAIIEVTTPEKTQRQWVLAGGTSFASSGLTERHFGLADAERVDVRIIWPDARMSTLHQVETNQFIKVVRE